MFQGEISEGMSAKLSQAILALSVSTFIRDICVVVGFGSGFLHAFPLGTQWYLLKKKNNKEKIIRKKLIRRVPPSLVPFLTIHTWKWKLRRENVNGEGGRLTFKCTFFSRKAVAGPHQSSFDTFCPQVTTLRRSWCS